MEPPADDGSTAAPRHQSLRALAEHALRVPLLGKLVGANLLIVLAALLVVVAERQGLLPGNAVSILGVALAMSLVVNLGLVYVALRPLNDLETAARIVRLKLHIVHASTEQDLDTAFKAVVQLPAGALVIGVDTFFNSQSVRLA